MHTGSASSPFGFASVKEETFCGGKAKKLVTKCRLSFTVSCSAFVKSLWWNSFDEELISGIVSSCSCSSC